VLARACFDACVLGDESQQRVTPHVWHVRRCTHRAPIFTHSSHSRAFACLTVAIFSMCPQAPPLMGVSLRRALELGPVPVAEGGAGVVGGLEKRRQRILVSACSVLAEFRCDFLGKVSPIHFFWGGFDLAVTRFSGRRAPERPGADAVTRESYSHEVISHGFWPGSGSVTEPSFYAYAAPEPAGFKTAAVQPAAAYYSTEFNEFLLPYEAVRNSPSPETALMDFLQSTYEAGANLAKWDRKALERPDTIR